MRHCMLQRSSTPSGTCGASFGTYSAFGRLRTLGTSLGTSFSLFPSREFDSLEDKLKTFSELMLVQTRPNETVVCTWLSAAEMKFCHSPVGIDMLVSLSNRGYLVPQPMAAI